VHWIHGGETNLDNLVLLCKRHHRMIHEGGWQLAVNEGRIIPIAPTVTFGLPRGPD
jgi:predicted restriction endonuclease